VASIGRLFLLMNPVSVSTEASHTTTLTVLLRIPEVMPESAGRPSGLAAGKSSVLPSNAASLFSEVVPLKGSHLSLVFTATLLVPFQNHSLLEFLPSINILGCPSPVNFSVSHLA